MSENEDEEFPIVLDENGIESNLNSIIDRICEAKPQDKNTIILNLSDVDEIEKFSILKELAMKIIRKLFSSKIDNVSEIAYISREFNIDTDLNRQPSDDSLESLMDVIIEYHKLSRMEMDLMIMSRMSIDDYELLNKYMNSMGYYIKINISDHDIKKEYRIKILPLEPSNSIIMI